MDMPISAAGTMSMAWMPLCGQSWIAAAASFLGMWTLMMAAMMLPSSTPALWRYRQSAGATAELPRAVLVLLAAAGYLLVWILLGAAVYPLGAAVTAVTMRHPALERAVPVATGLIVLIAGAVQLTRWKAHQLACCRGGCPHSSGSSGPASAGACAALCHGMRLGAHCCQCCAGLTAVLLVTGIMDVPAMCAVTAGITLERLAPAGERVARYIGLIVIGAGLYLIVRAAGLA